MKKILAMLLAVMMLLSVASVAMAEGDTDTPTTSISVPTIKFKKLYNLTNKGTFSPAETFTFTLVCTGVTDAASGIDATDAPTLTATDATFARGDAGSATNSKEITLTANKAFPSVGKYTYKMTETAGDTAGVTYTTSELELVIMAVNGTTDGEIVIGSAVLATKTADGESKEDSFANTYTAAALTVKKQVTGLLGDKNKKFHFTIDFTVPTGKTWTPDITGQGFTVATTTTEGATISYTFELANDESVTFGNLPEGVTYKVTETTVDDYETFVGSTDNKTNVATGSMEKTNVDVTYINNKGGELNMGVMLDSMPYVLVLAVVGAAVIALIAKKRRVED